MRRVALLAALLLPELPLHAEPSKLDTWVLVDGNDNQMSGNMSDIGAARAQQRDGEALLYARRGNQAFVIRDAGALQRARAVWAPARILGKTMEQLGRKMSQIGNKQGEIGTRMGAIGTRMATLAPDDPQRARLEAEMDALQKPMATLNEAMRPLSAEMEKRGEEMRKLSKRAEEQLAALVDDAIARGLATGISAPSRY
jgi:bla regulator protein blaR1